MIILCLCTCCCSIKAWEKKVVVQALHELYHHAMNSAASENMLIANINDWSLFSRSEKASIWNEFVPLGMASSKVDSMSSLCEIFFT